MNELVIKDIEKLAKDATSKAINDYLTSSGVIQKEINKMVGQISMELAPQLLEAFKTAAAAVCARPYFIEELIEASILKNSDKLEGSFKGAMAKAGRELGLDRETLTGLTDKVKSEIENRHEILGIGKFAS